jgi:hypothetical protein
MVADQPERYVPLFSGLHGDNAVTVADDGLSVSTARGAISVLTPGVWTRRFGAVPHPDLADGPRLAAYRIAVADLDACAACLDKGGFATVPGDTGLVVTPDQAFGVLIEFASTGE